MSTHMGNDGRWYWSTPDGSPSGPFPDRLAAELAAVAWEKRRVKRLELRELDATRRAKFPTRINPNGEY